MTDSVPPPLPMAKQSCCGRFPAFLTGLIVGAAVVGVAATIFIRKEHARAETSLAEARAALLQAGLGVPQVGQMFKNVLAGETPTVPDGKTASQADTDKIKKLGDDIVDDLRSGRALLVYRHTTPEFRKKMTLEEFEKTNVETVNVRNIYQLPFRVSKVLKATEGSGYEYYCTSGISTNQGTVNFAFTFVPADGDWQISEAQVKFQ